VQTPPPNEGAPTFVACILGMHRSGTSCLTGCLQERGLPLGEVSTFAQYNRKGNRESDILREINEDLLRFNGGSWDNPPKDLVWNDAFRKRRNEHLRKFRHHKKWGFKDPRTVLTLPFWLEADLNIHFIGTFRHPLAVARSLMWRPAVKPKSPPVKLWAHYNLKLLEYIEEFQFPLLCFDWPKEQYIKAIDEAAALFKLEKNSDALPGFYDSNLRKSQLADETVYTISCAEEEIYDKLMSHCIKV